MVHVSSLVRWQAKILVDRRERAYSPKNLRAVLAAIAATYDGADNRFPIVDWDGRPLDQTPEGRRKALGYLHDIVASARAD
jgi:hypothetical protein